MKDRLFQLMDALEITPNAFAETLKIERSTLSHIKSERSKPSLELVRKVLLSYPKVSSDWLIMGEGSMFKEIGDSREPNLFDQFNESPIVAQYEPKVSPSVETVVNKTSDSIPVVPSFETLPCEIDNAPQTKNKRQIERILVFYDDKTYEEYNQKC